MCFSLQMVYNFFPKYLTNKTLFLIIKLYDMRGVKIMNNCKKCGSVLNPGDVFCGTCGAQVSFVQNESNNMGGQINQNIQPTNNAVNQSMQNSQNQGVGIPNTQSMQGTNINNANQYMPNMQNPNMNNGMPNSNFIQNNANIDEILLDAYIGKNADKIKNTKFSCNFLLFNCVYAWYRKMWALGIIVLGTSFLTSLFLGDYGSLAFLVLIIVLSATFKNIYLSNVRKKVQKIKTNNPNATPEQLIAICQIKGGTTWVPVIIVFGISFILSLLYGFSGK